MSIVSHLPSAEGIGNDTILPYAAGFDKWERPRRLDKATAGDYNENTEVKFACSMMLHLPSTEGFGNDTILPCSARFDK